MIGHTITTQELARVRIQCPHSQPSRLTSSAEATVILDDVMRVRASRVTHEHLPEAVPTSGHFAVVEYTCTSAAAALGAVVTCTLSPNKAEVDSSENHEELVIVTCELAV